MSNQSLKQASVRSATGTDLTYEGDWHALFDLAGIAEGTFNGRLLDYINHKLSTDYVNLPQAMQVFAVDNGADNWNCLGTFDASEGDGSLDDVIASAIFDLDATKSASYSGSGTTWSNLVTSPADGTGQTANDFLFGDGATSTTYPVFTGSAGSSSAYLNFPDGDEYVSFKAGANTTFLNSLGRTTNGTDFWIALTIRFGADNLQRIYNTGVDAASPGWSALYLDNAEKVVLGQRGDTGTSVATSSATVVTGSTDYVIIVSHSLSNNNTRMWINSATAADFAQTYNATAAAAGLFTLFAESDAGFPLKAGTRVYSCAMGNEYLDNTKAAAIIAALEARHGRDYTP